MSVTGKVINGLVVLPPGTKLPEGAEVRIETLELTSEDDALVAAVEKLAKPRRTCQEITRSTMAITCVASQRNDEGVRRHFLLPGAP